MKNKGMGLGPRAGAYMMDQRVGFAPRLGAYLIDLIIVVLIIMLTSILAALHANFIALMFMTFIILSAYFTVLPAVWNGYTVGKKALGIRIVAADGSPAGIGKLILRAVVSSGLAHVTSGISSIISAFLISGRDDKCAIHDLAAGTYVTARKLEKAEKAA
ncbi:RDD family protein [Shouchella lonarensis]|uniref:Uncharacterized membrane protein YckC, RDD family n=1 Tax=Shouchella lonarensis TaxID=1464122 RepID=A0A1G6HCG5_9BACI|nr:RDD family protein [Shouchella lonarensis]SDB91635.1 Uncharacterized membrane protein YckC, RDD family [Shouchella lonarensis]